MNQPVSNRGSAATRPAVHAARRSTPPRPAPTAGDGTSTSPYLILFTLWLLVFTASCQVLIIAPLLPRIQQELGVPEALLGTLITADAVLVGVVALVMGPLSDRVGRRRILLLGTAMLAVAMAMHALATGYLSLLLVRGVAGAAGGILSGSAVSYVGDQFPYARRGWATGWIMSGAAFGQLLGIPIGVMLASTFSFRVPFLMFAVLAAVTLLLVWRVLPQPRVSRATGRFGFDVARTHYAQLLGRPEVVAAAAVFAMLFCSTALFFVYLPAWLEGSVGATPRDTATLFFVGGVASVLVGPVSGKLSDRAGRKRVIVASCWALGGVVALTPVVVSRVWMGFAAYFLIMALISARQGPFQALITAIVSDDRRGTLVSLIVGLGQLGFGVGGALAGLVFASWGYGVSSLLAAGLLLASAALIRRLPEPRRDDAARPEREQERRSPARLAAVLPAV